MSAPDLQRFTESIDWSQPDSITDDGLRVFNVRCRVPLPPLAQVAAVVPQVARDANALDLADMAAEMGVRLRGLEDLGHNGDGGQPERVLPDDGDGIILPDAATGDPGTDDEVMLADPLISGIASSTSVDFFGTEMHVRALKQMAVQMLRDGGLVYLPRHNRGLAGSIEWDEVIGRTVHAEVVPTEQAAKPFNEAEAQWMLRVTVQLFNDEPAAQALVRRIARGEKIGQSIGGWFTNLQIVQNEDGDVERVIVLGVELDHLAVTRAPANPDSLGLVHLRSVLGHSAAAHRARSLLPRVVAGQVVCTTPTIARSMADLALQERHVLDVVDNGDGTASIRLAIADDPVESDDDGEMEAGKKKRDLDPAPDARTTDHNPPQADAASTGANPVLDTGDATGDDANAPDARRSALPTDDHTLATDPVAQSDEEPAMEPTDLTLDQIRDLFKSEIAPLAQRLDAVEQRATPEPTPAPAPEPTVDPRLAEAEAKAAEAIARAQAAEQALAVANRRPMRQGRSVVPSFGAGPVARTGYEGLVGECRTAAPTVAAVAERCISTVTEADGAGKVSRADCIRTLNAMLNAAEADGIITDPNHRAAWQ